MKIHPKFPKGRRRDPKRQAELLIYEKLKASNVPGYALYEVRVDQHCRELDFLVLLEGAARIGIELKGGLYRLVGGEWQLLTPEGWQKVPNPISQLWDAAMGLRDTLGERLNHKSFIIPVLSFPDMEPDQDIADRASAAKVQVIWGTERFVERLVELAEVSDVFYPPSAEDIKTEIEAIVPGLTGDPAPSEMDLQARQVIIQHVDTVNVYTTGAVDPQQEVPHNEG